MDSPHTQPPLAPGSRVALACLLATLRQSLGSWPTPLPKKITKDYLAAIAKVPLELVQPEIVRLAKDQYGCRFLQKRIDDNMVALFAQRQHNFEVIFAEIYPHMYELIIDPFGNYLIQKMTAYCTEPHLNVILEGLQYNLFQILINQHGTRALQRIIDNLNNHHQLQVLIAGLKPYIIELIKDLNGNHVIQKILNKYMADDCQFIYDLIIDDLFVVATHKHGCCVLQKCLNHVTMAQLGQFLAAILAPLNFGRLINDQFGNYVLQYLILINLWEINYAVFGNFVRHGVGQLCTLKFLLNVVEKFLKNCFANEGLLANFSSLKFELIYHILAGDLNKLINDPYGNYVVQTLVDIVANPQVTYVGPQGFTVDNLAQLLPHGCDDDLIQIAVIKTWFQKCKIVLLFGKRIQLKINIILNNCPRSRRYGFNGQMGQFGLQGGMYYGMNGMNQGQMGMGQGQMGMNQGQMAMGQGNQMVQMGQMGQMTQGSQGNQGNQMGPMNPVNLAILMNQPNQANQANQANQPNQANQANQANQPNQPTQPTHPTQANQPKPTLNQPSQVMSQTMSQTQGQHGAQGFHGSHGSHGPFHVPGLAVNLAPLATHSPPFLDDTPSRLMLVSLLATDLARLGNYYYGLGLAPSLLGFPQTPLAPLAASTGATTPQEPLAPHKRFSQDLGDLVWGPQLGYGHARQVLLASLCGEPTLERSQLLLSSVGGYLPALLGVVWAQPPLSQLQHLLQQPVYALGPGAGLGAGFALPGGALATERSFTPPLGYHALHRPSLSIDGSLF